MTTAKKDNRNNTIILKEWSEEPDSSRRHKLFNEVFEKNLKSLHELAASKLRRERYSTLTATAVVNEAWIRFRSASDPEVPENTKAFHGFMARAMHQILVDRARQKRTEKHGGHQTFISLQSVEVPGETTNNVDIIAVHDAIEALKGLKNGDIAARALELRYFADLTIKDVAEALGRSPSATKTALRFAIAHMNKLLASAT